MAPLTPELRQRLGLPNQAHGAVVAGVRPGSAAEQSGLRPGDVVVGVGNRSVGSAEEAAGAIRDALHDGSDAKGADQALALRVMRDGHTAFVAVDTSAVGTAPAQPDQSDAG